MIRNETFRDGACIAAEIIDLAAGTYAREEHGVIVEGPRPLSAAERIAYGPRPLDATGALATLLVVEGVLPINDAANAIGATPDQLVAEAQGWAAAAG